MGKSSASILLIVCIGLFVIGGFFYLNNITGNAILADYAPPYNILKNNVSIFNITPEQIDGHAAEIVNIGVNVSMPKGYVYKKGYIFNYNSGRWEVFNFDQTAVGSSYWIQDFASVDLIVNSSSMLRRGENYIVAYACEKDNISKEWKCGCNGPTSCEKWMLRIFNVTNISNPAVPNCTSTANCSVMDICDLGRQICVPNVTIMEPPIFAGGTGTLSDPYEIATWEQLNKTRLYLDAYYILTANLSSGTANYSGLGNNWTPIGSAGGTCVGAADPDCSMGRAFLCYNLCGGTQWMPLPLSFAGNFNGNGNTISDLIVSGTDYIGLFGVLSGDIYNISLINVNANGSSYIGGLVGLQQAGTISNSSFIGNVSGSFGSVGGLVGLQEGGTISNSYSIGNTNGYDFVGGLVGAQTWGTVINNSYSLGNVRSSSSYVGGLVGYSLQATISNSSFIGNVSGSVESVGGLVGYFLQGTISNSYSLGNVNGTCNYVGGLVGLQEGTISNSYSRGNVSGFGGVGGLVGEQRTGTISNSYSTGNTNGYDYVGGLAGGSQGTISNSYTGGNVNGSGNYIGGLAGGSTVAITNSYSTGNVSGSSYVGGFAGGSGGTITNSSSNGSVNGSGDYVGGLVGYQYTETITNSYATGKTKGVTSVGGFVGYLSGPVSNSYSLGNVSGSNYVGGFVGILWVGTISNSYARGNASGTSYIGGLVGLQNGATMINKSYSTGKVSGSSTVGGLVGSGGTATYSYWDNQTSGRTTSGAGTGKTTAQMKNQTVFTNVGWDFTSKWTIDSSQIKNNGYPYLIWQDG